MVKLENQTVLLAVLILMTELFADGGGTVLTDLFFPNSDFQEIRLYCKGGEVKNVTATTISLNSIWQ